VDDYVTARSETSFAEFEAELDSILRRVERFRPVGPDTEILEVGAGLGWFEIICSRRGLSCSGIEVNPAFIDAAQKLAKEHGVEIDLRQADIQTLQLPGERYDVVIATSVFEHVPQYGRALAKIYEALRPGGVLYFYSTNKFSFTSGEFPEYPLYGWLPYAIRKRIRVSRQGSEVVDTGLIDFNQFTSWGLRRHFRSLGFSLVMDQLDYLRPDDIFHGSATRKLGLAMARRLAPARALLRLFAPGNSFICVK